MTFDGIKGLVESVPAELLACAGAASVVMMVASLIVTPMLLVRIRPDYFQHPKPHLLERLRESSLPRCLLLVAKNLIGFILLLAGLLMLVLPGQGLLTILIGLLLMDFPGKFELERRLVHSPKILDTINWLRKKAHRPPLDL